MKIFLSMILAVAIFCFASNLSLAQDEEDMDYSWGAVVKVSPIQIIVSEYDYDSDEERDVVYKVNPDTELRNTESLKDLAEGDSVEINYVVEEKENIAKVITLEESYLEEEYSATEELGEEIEYLPEETEEVEY